MQLIHLLLGWFLEIKLPKDQRGLSQSTENAVLLAGAAAIALVIVTVITDYVTKNLPK